MKFGLNTLLPKIFSQRWIQLMSVVDSILNEIQTESINIILDQFDIEKATNEQILDEIKFFGYEVSYLDGYTSTKEYLVRQYLSLDKRKKYRNLKEAYETILKIYFQKGTVYPLYYDVVSEYYIPYENWWNIIETLKIINILDSDKDNLLYYIAPYLDDSSLFDSFISFDYDVAVYGSPKKTNLSTAYLDTPDLIETLDQFYEIENITRYNYIQIICRKLLSDDSFFDYYSMFSFIYDMNNNHRSTEVLYFFPKIYLYTKNDNTETNIEIEKYDKSLLKNINSILLSGTLEDTQYIKYGTGYTDSSLIGITQLINQTQSFTISQVYIKEKTENILSFFTKVTKNVKAFSFSEIGLYNIYNELIYYACFPSIIFPDNINGGNEIYVKLDTEENVTNFYSTL